MQRKRENIMAAVDLAKIIPSTWISGMERKLHRPVDTVWVKNLLSLFRGFGIISYLLTVMPRSRSKHAECASSRPHSRWCRLVEDRRSILLRKQIQHSEGRSSIYHWFSGPGIAEGSEEEVGDYFMIGFDCLITQHYFFKIHICRIGLFP